MTELTAEGTLPEGPEAFSSSQTSLSKECRETGICAGDDGGIRRKDFWSTEEQQKCRSASVLRSVLLEFQHTAGVLPSLLDETRISFQGCGILQ